MLREIFQQLTGKYTSNLQLAERLWQEIDSHYSGSGRYYHTISHLKDILFELEVVQPQIKNWDTILFALFYHDIIYHPTSRRNEEKSAELASSRLSEIAYPKDQIEKCKAVILATRSHTGAPDPDVNCFIDADLSILGQKWDTYLTYVNNIRKEYSVYPDFMYKRGRKKVLSRFLAMSHIYKTDFFFSKFESAAKENLRREISML